MQQQSPSQATQDLLLRLSQRPGVQSTLILSRDTGAIVSSSGLITADEVIEEDTTPTNATNVPDDELEPAKKGTRKIEDVAELVYTFVKSAGAMAEGLNGAGDETKLLRLRTKRNELVVVPGTRGLEINAWRCADYGYRCEVLAGGHT